MSNEDVIQHLNETLGLDVNGADYARVIAHASRLDDVSRSNLLQFCSDRMKEAPVRKMESVRVGLVRTLVALLPDTFGLIQTYLSDQSTHHCYETHFTLFCYLDWSAELPNATSISQRVLGTIKEYMYNVKSSTASAAWMAGDLLGGHWAPNESVPVLLLTAETAKYVAGRIGSIHGLAMLLRRSDIEHSMQQKINDSLRHMSKNDVSKKVRGIAAGAIVDHY